MQHLNPKPSGINRYVPKELKEVNQTIRAVCMGFPTSQHNFSYGVLKETLGNQHRPGDVILIFKIVTKT